MSQISLKSISGITSITTPAGVDNQLTVHTNDTTEKLKVTSDGVNVTGVITATNFVGNLTGNVTGNVTGGASSITGSPDVSLGNVNAGIVTATSFKGDGSNLSGITQTTIVNYADNKLVTATGDATTLNAESRFTFNGTTATIGDQSSNTATELLIARGEVIAGGSGPVITLKHGPSSGTQRTHEIYSHTGDLRIVADSNENMEFHTGGSESLRISSNKNVSVANTITAGQVAITTTNTTIRNTGVGTAAGTLIFNSTDNQLQVYTHDNVWQKCNEGTVTTTEGGATSDNSNRAGYITHTFNSPGNFVTDGSVFDVEIMAIGGGGGGGGRRYGAGGGAGGVVYKTGVTLAAGTYGIVIGGGGSSNPSDRGSNGANTTFAAGTPQALTAKGGGGGGCYDGTYPGAPGGSGGGGTARCQVTPGGSATQPGTNSAPATDYGNRGGNYGPAPCGYAPGGGGGAGGNGTDSVPGAGINGGGNGGIGVQLAISGSNTYYAGGGAGSIYYQVGPAGGNSGPADHYGAGGNGGGGVSNSNLPGSYAGGSPPGHGASNTGGGGAGSHAQAPGANVFSGASGGSGGSGKVIIAYSKSANPTVQLA